jgi:hypothetical protein
MAGRCVSVDSSSITMSGSRPSGGTGVDLIKVNGSGTPVWGLRLQIGAAGYESGAGHSSRDSDRSYFAANYRYGAHISCFSDAYGSTVTRNWTKLIQNTNSARIVLLSDLGYDGNYVSTVVGLDYNGSTYSDYYPIMCKFTGGTAGGAMSWARALNPASVSGTLNFGWNMASKGGNGHYVIGSYTTSASYTNSFGVVAKYNTSGVLQWTRVLSYNQAGGNGFATGSAIYATGDSTEYIYAVFAVASMGGAQTQTVIIKYDSSGTVVWQRSIRALIGSVNYSLIMKSIARVEGSSIDRLVLTGTRYRTSNSDYYSQVTIKIPADGSRADGGVITLSTNNYFYYSTSTLLNSTAGGFTDLNWAGNLSITDGVSSVTMTTVTPTQTTPSSGGGTVKGF